VSTRKTPRGTRVSRESLIPVMPRNTVFGSGCTRNSHTKDSDTLSNAQRKASLDLRNTHTRG
jgi:hypothetical protein